MNKFYVYLLYDPRTPCEPFYVGKGCGNRAWAHSFPSVLEENFPVHRKIRKLLAFGVEPDVDFQAESLYEFEAFDLEKKLIRRFGRQNNGTGCLLNLTDGGEGCSGRILSDETKLKMRLQKLGKKGHPSSKRRPIIGKCGGQVVERYTDSRAAEREGGHQREHISQCLRGKRYQHHGLFWEYDL